MLIGVDFDNTIVRYDALFHRVALERGLIPAELPASKSTVRDYLRRHGREDDWTELQGSVYGARMHEAEPFPGVVACLARLVRDGIPVRIVSHKTRQPFRGPSYDLHQAARDWLVAHRFFEADGVNLAPGDVIFELTLGDKLRRIGEIGCTHFIDDLPECLGHPSFPANVERILFDPAGAEGGQAFRRVESWPSIPALLFGAGTEPEPDLAAAVRRLLGLDAGASLALDPVSGGGNNRAFRATAGGAAFFVKAYFHGAHDTRNRLDAEFSFSRYAWDLGVRALPRPIACDPARHVGIYEFVEGTAVDPDGATPDRVRQAVEFQRRVNQTAGAAPSLPDASEACFSLAEHAGCVTRRVDALAGIETGTEAADAAAEFVRARLAPAWSRVLDGARHAAARRGLSWDEPIEPPERILSPSDFGFHNALVRPDGTLAFVDFEYAGWDDPAKLVSDFFCQPAVPVSPAYRAWMADAVFDGRPGGARGRARADVLWPMYHIKWIAILLNEFLPHAGARRRFARPADDWRTRQAVQLRKARAGLDALAAVGAPLSATRIS